MKVVDLRTPLVEAQPKYSAQALRNKLKNQELEKQKQEIIKQQKAIRNQRGTPNSQFIKANNQQNNDQKNNNQEQKNYGKGIYRTTDNKGNLKYTTGELDKDGQIKVDDKALPNNVNALDAAQDKFNKLVRNGGFLGNKGPRLTPLLAAEAEKAINAVNKDVGTELRTTYGNDFMVRFINAFGWNALRNKNNQFNGILQKLYSERKDLGKSLSINDFEKIYNLYVHNNLNKDAKDINSKEDLNELINNKDTQRNGSNANGFGNWTSSLSTSSKQNLTNSLKNLKKGLSRSEINGLKNFMSDDMFNWFSNLD